MNIGQRIKTERKRLGKTQKEAADLVGVSREIFGRYERNKVRPSSSTLQRFSNIGADITFILSGIHGAEQLKQRIRDLESLLKIARFPARSTPLEIMQEDA